MNLVNEGVLPPNELDDRDERREEREMAQERETLADILAEYRNDADAMDRGELYQPTTEYLRRLLDRIEAIDSADAWRSLYSPGNAAATREALVLCSRIIGANGIRGNVFLDDIQEAHRAITAALSAPPRQCDVGTAEEQAERHSRFCISQGGHCKQCPAHGRSHNGCVLAWAQMPYEAEEGGAK